ncbi:hypothetical protein Lesp01_80290 [Lentzea sp. NBRC 102530]|nr:hypothetical protein Lesp01_80290 [Lentzea sp. NBRC 102530]
MLVRGLDAPTHVTLQKGVLSAVDAAALDGVLVRGKGIEAPAVPAAILVGFSLVVGFLASRVLKWEE